MSTAGLKTHLLKDVCHRVADGGSGCERQVNDAEGHVKASCRLAGNQLTHTGDLEGGPLDDLGKSRQVAVSRPLDGAGNNAGAGNANVYNTFGLANTVESARHKGIVLGYVGKNNQLGAGHGAVVTGEISRPLDDLAHFGYGVHVDARLGAGYVDGGANHVSLGKGLGNDRNKIARTLGSALVDQRREAADKVDAQLGRRAVQRLGDLYVALGGNVAADEGDGSNRNSLVDDGNAVLLLDLLANGHQIACGFCYLVVDLLAKTVLVLADTVEKGYAHGNGADIQLFLTYHIYCFKNICRIKHSDLRSCAWS